MSRSGITVCGCLSMGCVGIKKLIDWLLLLDYCVGTKFQKDVCFQTLENAPLKSLLKKTHFILRDDNFL